MRVIVTGLREDQRVGGLTEEAPRVNAEVIAIGFAPISADRRDGARRRLGKT